MSDEGRRERVMTVARVREDEDGAQVTFHESARFYQLPRASRDYGRALQALRAAAAQRRPVTIRFTAPNADTIESVLP